MFWTLFSLAAAPFVGSFIGLLTLRLPAGRRWIATRSACDACHRRLGPLDLIPIVSFLGLRGRCRTCRAAIPIRYPLLETAALGVAAWSALAQSGAMVPVTAIFGWGLLAVAVIDAENLWLPDVLTLPLGAAGWAFTVSLGLRTPLAPLIGAAAGYGALALVAFVYKALRGRPGLGGGDPFLLGAIGAWVGWRGLPTVLLWSCGVGLAIAAIISLARRRLDLARPLPFGTFLAVGAWLTWLLGPSPGAS
ncbi:prepilin signal peptidase PulO-like peptidase [Caulobacter sp. AP07]|uniref:prepilin peptidase n=1 Tax=Caulobacter sp. AP07 TaxID=1144304 RepID=UPI000271E399|nr:A24 family peptidase [Caulobacter sp. AP07]EJL34232.1 prepilin signal peptidase PulO-like peptidase [Caulobacter sp. AP07]